MHIHARLHGGRLVKRRAGRRSSSVSRALGRREVVDPADSNTSRLRLGRCTLGRVVCVEQSLHHLLRLVDRVYILRNGALVGEETAASLLERDDYWDLF